MLPALSWIKTQVKPLKKSRKIDSIFFFLLIIIILDAVLNTILSRSNGFLFLSLNDGRKKEDENKKL